MVSLPYVFILVLTHPACRPVNDKFGGVLGINNKKKLSSDIGATRVERELEKKDGSDEFGVMALREALKMARIKDHLTSSFFFFLLLHLTSNTRLFSITNCLVLG